MMTTADPRCPQRLLSLVNPLALPLALALAVPAWSQSTGNRLPRFEDYPVKEIFEGTPAAPKLMTPVERRYRTRIREGVEKGWDVVRDGKEVPGPNFAGKMIVVQWSCGAPCMMMAMVDAQTGTVYYPPISFSGVGVQSFDLPLLTVGLSVSRNPNVEFRLDSRLMVVQATPKQTAQHPSYTYFFLWQNERWNLLRRVPLKEQ